MLYDSKDRDFQAQVTGSRLMRGSTLSICVCASHAAPTAEKQAPPPPLPNYHCPHTSFPLRKRGELELFRKSWHCQRQAPPLQHVFERVQGGAHPLLAENRPRLG